MTTIEFKFSTTNPPKASFVRYNGQTFTNNPVSIDIVDGTFAMAIIVDSPGQEALVLKDGVQFRTLKIKTGSKRAGCFVP